MGLLFTPDRFQDLVWCTVQAAKGHAEASPERFAKWIVADGDPSERVAALAPYVTIGETYFYREPAYLEVYAEVILPPLFEAAVASRRPLRIWCAGCSSGEEAYTLAILTHDLAQTHPVTILATDLNEEALDQARAGRYSTWSFRNTPEAFRSSYFSPLPGGLLEVDREIRERVHFFQINLASAAYPSVLNGTIGLDLIFCRNVLMYLTPEVRRRALASFAEALNPSGWLQLSASEKQPDAQCGFVPVTIRGKTFYQKGTQGRPSLKETRGVTRVSSKPPVKHHAKRAVLRRPMSTSTKDVPPSSTQPLPERTLAAAAGPEASQLFRDGDYGACIALLQQEEQRLASGWGLGARAWAMIGEGEHARAWAEEAIRLGVLEAEVYYLHGVLLSETGARTEAVSSLKRALFLNPDLIMAHMTLGNLYLIQGKNRAAMRHYKTVKRSLLALDATAVVPLSQGLTAGQVLAMTASMEKKA